MDFAPRINNDMGLTQGSGGHSFEMFDLKPVYGVPRAADAQGRAGWEFRSKLGVIQQYDVFPQPLVLRSRPSSVPEMTSG